MVNWDRGISEGVIANHWVANNPVCCYLYTTGMTLNNELGDPSMAEIIPVDRMATEAKWSMSGMGDNAPYRRTTLITTRLEDEANVSYNGTPLPDFIPIEGNSRTETDGFVTYEISTSTYYNRTINVILDAIPS